MTVSMRQLEAIPECRLKHEMLRACGVERDGAGWSREWNTPGEAFRLQYAGEPNTFVVWGKVVDFSTRFVDGSTRFVDFSTRFVDGSTALKLSGHRPGTPTGDAIRAYLRRWGWVPKEKRKPEPQENTKTII